jgi:hypothetical protein
MPGISANIKDALWSLVVTDKRGAPHGGTEHDKVMWYQAAPYLCLDR